MRRQDIESPVSRRLPSASVAIDQTEAIQCALSQLHRSVDEVAKVFKGGRGDIITHHLETLSIVGEVRLRADGAYHVADTGV